MSWAGYVQCPEIQPHGLIQRHTTRPPPRQRRATPNLAQPSPCRNPQPSRRRRRARGAVPLHPAPPARLFLHPPTGARYLRTVHRRLRYIGYLRRYVPASPALHLAPAGLCTARHITITLHPLRRPGPGRESDLHHHLHHHHQPVFRPLARRVHAAAYRVGPLSIPPSFPTTTTPTTTTTTTSSTSAATTPTSTSLLLIHLSPKAIDSSLQRLPTRSHSSASSSSHLFCHHRAPVPQTTRHARPADPAGFLLSDNAAIDLPVDARPLSPFLVPSLADDLPSRMSTRAPTTLR